jgi:energy-coupling factor transporter ATP-binding protein EcfA2
VKLLEDRPERDPLLLRSSVTALAHRLSSLLDATDRGLRIAIVGPRGSGRSTLLAALHDRLTVPAAHVDLRALPEGSPFPSLLGALLRTTDVPDGVRHRIRAACWRLVDPAAFARHEPARQDAVDVLRETMAPVEDAPRVLCVDAPDDADLASLRLLAAVAPSCSVVWTAPSGTEAAIRINVGRLPPEDVAALAGPLAQDAPLQPGHVQALQDLFHDPIFANPRALKRCLRTLMLLRAFEGDAHDPEADAVARWVATVDRWPLLATALRSRDDRWWRDLRLALDQAVPVRPDSLAEAMLALPGFAGWLATHVPRPNPATLRGFGGALAGLRASQARLDRWGL